MKLSISNIGWECSHDELVYDFMKSQMFSGIEIAPTRIIPDKPYDNIEYASKWAAELIRRYGFTVPSMQSIWYGRTEKLFGSKEERKILVDYTKKAILFAEAIGCKNLVFGCPRNRALSDGADPDDAIAFFRTIGDFALEHNTVIAMEANPPIYNTNYINDTKSAIDLIKKVQSNGFQLNLDVGTMVENGESTDILQGNEKYINHVHISEPGLKPIQERKIHHDLADILRNCNYGKFISIEMGRQADISVLQSAMIYVKEIFE